MTELGSFLAPFPAAAVAAIEAIAGDAAVVVADPLTRRFRLDPEAALASVRTQLHGLLHDRPPATVAWCYEADPSTGLEGFEVSAILDRHLAVERVEQVLHGTARRIVAVGRPRTHHVVIGLNAGALTDPDLAGLIQESTSDGWPGTLLFITAGRLAQLRANEGMTMAVSAFQQSGGSIGLFVPDAETDLACGDPAAYLRSVRQSGLPIHAVRFERGLALEPAKLDGFMRASGMTCDTSVPIDSGAAAPGEPTRPAAYAGASPYFPQPFDLRVPWFRSEAPPWIELPMFPLSTAGSIADWWASATWPDDRTLVQRLDARRMAAFFRASRVSPELERAYPAYRIYNWPRSAPADRVSLLDAGAAPAPQLAALKRSLSALRQEQGAGVVWLRAGEMIPRARVEVMRRYDLSTVAAMDVQHATHTYLGDVPRSAPLREDYAEFARFISPAIGDALEIGSGYGVLAWALSPRSRRYVCVDLDHRMFSALRADLGQSAVVADAHTLPFGDASFDSIVANNVIEHFYDPLAGLREIRRLLRPGGRLFALLPFDALNSRHDLPAHLWKLDLAGVQRALPAAGLDIARIEVIDLHALGVPGAFPSCSGLAAMVEAGRPSAGSAHDAGVVHVRDAATTKPRTVRAGRVWPSIREVVQFEKWSGRRVLAVGAAPDDVDEFRHFGAQVTEAPPDLPWVAADRSADLVYLFLPAAPSGLTALASEIARVIAPGGRAVAVFRNRNSFRYWSRIRSYFGHACQLDLDGPDRLAAIVEGEAPNHAGYVDVAAVEQAFGAFAQKRIRISNLLPEDLAGGENEAYPAAFWNWMDETFGRFVTVSVTR